MVAGCFIYFLCQISCDVNFMPLITPPSSLVEAVFNKVWALSGICPSSTEKWRALSIWYITVEIVRSKGQKGSYESDTFCHNDNVLHEYNERPKNNKLTSLAPFYTSNLICKNRPCPRKNSQKAWLTWCQSFHGSTKVRGRGACACVSPLISNKNISIFMTLKNIYLNKSPIYHVIKMPLVFCILVV